MALVNRRSLGAYIRYPSGIETMCFVSFVVVLSLLHCVHRLCCQALSAPGTGLIVNDRLLNSPPKLGPPLMQFLMEAIQEAADEGGWGCGFALAGYVITVSYRDRFGHVKGTGAVGRLCWGWRSGCICLHNAFVCRFLYLCGV